MLEPGDTPELVDALLNQRIDLALTLKASNESQLEFHPLFTDELHFIVRPRCTHVAKSGRAGAFL